MSSFVKVLRNDLRRTWYAYIPAIALALLALFLFSPARVSFIPPIASTSAFVAILKFYSILILAPLVLQYDSPIQINGFSLTRPIARVSNILTKIVPLIVIAVLLPMLIECSVALQLKTPLDILFEVSPRLFLYHLATVMPFFLLAYLLPSFGAYLIALFIVGLLVGQLGWSIYPVSIVYVDRYLPASAIAQIAAATSFNQTLQAIGLGIGCIVGMLVATRRTRIVSAICIALPGILLFVYALNRISSGESPKLNEVTQSVSARIDKMDRLAPALIFNPWLAETDQQLTLVREVNRIRIAAGDSAASSIVELNEPYQSTLCIPKDMLQKKLSTILSRPVTILNRTACTDAKLDLSAMPSVIAESTSSDPSLQFLGTVWELTLQSDYRAAIAGKFNTVNFSRGALRTGLFTRQGIELGFEEYAVVPNLIQVLERKQSECASSCDKKREDSSPLYFAVNPSSGEAIEMLFDGSDLQSEIGGMMPMIPVNELVLTTDDEHMDALLEMTEVVRLTPQLNLITTGLLQVELNTAN